LIPAFKKSRERSKCLKRETSSHRTTGIDRQFKLAGLEQIGKDQKLEENGMLNLSKRKIANTLLLLSMYLVLLGCKEDAPPPIERIRAIKTITVTERVSGINRNFPGSVEAVDKSNLSFEVSGNVKELGVEVGDTVKKGQDIATLDRQPFKLNVQAAEAEVKSAQVDLKHQKKNLERFQEVRKKDPGAISLRHLEQAEAAYERARNSLSYSETQLNLAIRDLEKTKLSAPFDAVIAARHVEPFQEVKRGEPIYDIFIEGAMKVVIDIPEIIIESISRGLTAEIRFPKSPDRVYEGIVSEIGSTASSASTFPVKVAIKDAGARIRPGMSADVSLVLYSSDEEAGFLIPYDAIVPGDKKTTSSIFIFDPKTSTVKKAQIKSSVSKGNNIVVTKGIKPGDIVAIAGVSYLKDGQKVKLMD
jgi:RND family efflux transporter MFP subunit